MCMCRSTGFVTLTLSKVDEALHYDHCMATISPQIRAQILQTLYVVTGCDYVSYFHGIGKIKFLQVFFQHASFISNGQEQLARRYNTAAT